MFCLIKNDAKIRVILSKYIRFSISTIVIWVYGPFLCFSRYVNSSPNSFKWPFQTAQRRSLKPPILVVPYDSSGLICFIRRDEEDTSSCQVKKIISNGNVQICDTVVFFAYGNLKFCSVFSFLHFCSDVYFTPKQYCRHLGVLYSGAFTEQCKELMYQHNTVTLI